MHASDMAPEEPGVPETMRRIVSGAEHAEALTALDDESVARHPHMVVRGSIARHFDPEVIDCEAKTAACAAIVD